MGGEHFRVGNAEREFVDFRGTGVVHFVEERLEFELDRALLFGEFAAGLRDLRVAVDRTVGPVNTGKNGLNRVVVFLFDGVEFVVVAAGAVDGLADKRGHGLGHHVVTVQKAGNVLVGGAFT